MKFSSKISSCQRKKILCLVFLRFLCAILLFWKSAIFHFNKDFLWCWKILKQTKKSGCPTRVQKSGFLYKKKFVFLFHPFTIHVFATFLCYCIVIIIFCIVIPLTFIIENVQVMKNSSLYLQKKFWSKFETLWSTFPSHTNRDLQIWLKTGMLGNLNWQVQNSKK